jgi:hypothetical protein
VRVEVVARLGRCEGGWVTSDGPVVIEFSHLGTDL